MERQFVLFLAFSVFTTALAAQAPARLKFQGITPAADTDYQVRVNIYEGEVDGSVALEQYFSLVTSNANRVFSLEIGDPAANVSGSLETINWAADDYFMEVEIRKSPAEPWQTIGTPQQILSVPYALVSGNGKIYSNSNQDEYLPIYGTNGEPNINIGGRSSGGSDHNYGSLGIYDEEGEANIQAFSTDAGGWMYTRGPNNNRNIELSVLSGANYPNRGAIRIRNDEGNTRAYTGVANDGVGFLNLYGQNGEHNFIFSHSSGHPNRGAMTIRDEHGNAQVSLYVNGNGDGYIAAGGASGGVKSFVMPHPERPGKDIVYACIEGPEAAAYDRGTAELINGEAFIPFSETFGIVANPETMTIMTSPWSAESKGLAVVERTEAGFRVKELYSGTGNYRFDWEVKAVRKGWEDFEVIRDDRPVVDDSHEQYREIEDPIMQNDNK